MMNDYKKWISAQPLENFPVPMKKLVTDQMVRLAVPMTKIVTDDSLSRGSENTSEYISRLMNNPSMLIEGLIKMQSLPIDKEEAKT